MQVFTKTLMGTQVNVSQKKKKNKHNNNEILLNSIFSKYDKNNTFLNV